MTHLAQPPRDAEQFFIWLKAASEQYWATLALDHRLYGFQIQAGTRWLPGLSSAEIAGYEAELGFAFPAIYRHFLGHMNGTDTPAINLYGESGEPHQYAPAYYGYPHDLELVNNQITWIYNEFHITSAIVEQNMIPHIMPIVGHRFLVMDRCETHPVLSMYGRDTIVYTSDLPSLLLQDIFARYRSAPIPVAPDVRFWLDDRSY